MKTNKTFGAAKRLASLLVAVVVLMTAFSSNAFAANQAVQDDCNGVLLIEWGYANNGVFTPYSVGSGFLINDNTIITCYHVVHATTAEQERDLAGKFGDGWKKKMEIHIVYQAGNYYTATEIAEIANSYADYTALTIGSKTISGHTKLTLSTAEAAKTDSVNALGFPYETTLIEDTTSGTFTVKDVNVMTGTVNKAAVSIDGIDYINHSASLVAGYSGGPLVDENGYVIGINAGKIDNSFNYAITISQLIESLKTTSTEYSSTEGGSTDASSDKPADKIILHGNCTKRYKDKGMFIPGCPPGETGMYLSIKLGHVVDGEIPGCIENEIRPNMNADHPIWEAYVTKKAEEFYGMPASELAKKYE